MREEYHVTLYSQMGPTGNNEEKRAFLYRLFL